MDPDFENSGFVFFSYTPLADPAHHRISRFKITPDSFFIQSERVLLEIPIDIENGWHGINAMEFDSKENLYIAIGDFTIQNEEVAGYAQIDERRKKNDLQSTSANTNNLQGKINRIHPEKDGTYTIPEGNLFPNSDSLTKPAVTIVLKYCLRLAKDILLKYLSYLRTFNISPSFKMDKMILPEYSSKMKNIFRKIPV